MKQEIRIISGLYRGKKIPFPLVDGLRPTSDRIKETLFNWLMHRVREAHCLDAFAGSGSLGLEAFSRGAAKVVFVEQSPRAHANLQRIVSQFNSPKLDLVKDNTLHYLQEVHTPFDLIFLDPPFSLKLIPQCLSYLINGNLINQGGLVYIESQEEVEVDKTQWQLIKLNRSGHVVYGLLEKL